MKKDIIITSPEAWNKSLKDAFLGRPIEFMNKCKFNKLPMKLTKVEKMMIDFDRRFKETITITHRSSGKSTIQGFCSAYDFSVRAKAIVALSLSHARSKDILRDVKSITYDTPFLGIAERQKWNIEDSAQSFRNLTGASFTAIAFSSQAVMGKHPEVFRIDEASEFYNNSKDGEKEFFTNYIIPTQQGLMRDPKIYPELPEIHITSVGGDSRSYFASMVKNSSIETDYKKIPHKIKKDYVKEIEKLLTKELSLEAPRIYWPYNNIIKIEDKYQFYKIYLKDKILDIKKKNNGFEVLHLTPKDAGISKQEIARLAEAFNLNAYGIKTQFYGEFIARVDEPIVESDLADSLVILKERWDPNLPTVAGIDLGKNGAETAMEILQPQADGSVVVVGSYIDHDKNPAEFANIIKEIIVPKFNPLVIAVDTTSDESFVSFGSKWNQLPLKPINWDKRYRPFMLLTLREICKSKIKTEDGEFPKLQIPNTEKGKELVTKLKETSMGTHVPDRVAALGMALVEVKNLFFTQEMNTQPTIGIIENKDMFSDDGIAFRENNFNF